MNTQDQKPATSPAVPAAALLFQAPAFPAPAFQTPVFAEPVSQPQPSAKAKKQGDSASGDARKAKPRKKGQAASKTKSGEPGADDDAHQPSRAKKPQKQKSGGEQADETDSAPQGAETDAPDGETKKKAKPRKKTAEPEGGADADAPDSGDAADGPSSTRRRRRRARSSDGEESSDQVQSVQGSTRLEAKRMRRREGRREGRRRQSITEAEFLARRESVDREMIVRHQDGADQIAVLEDGILVEHFVARRTAQTMVGNIYLGRVQNVLPSMEAAFVDIGRGRNAVLYAGEVNWDQLGMEGKPRRIESALKSGDAVMVQVTKDPIGHKGARLTSQITLAGRYLVFVPGSSMLGISRKLPDGERARLKKVLREVVPQDAGVIVRTAAEGATEEQLRDDVERLVKQWQAIQKKAKNTKKAPILLRGEPELVVRVVRDLFNEDISKLVVQGDQTWDKVREYVEELSPELMDRVEHWTGDDVFKAKRVTQQLSKAMDRKVWLPSGGTLIIERTEALTVVDVNTGKFVGSGGTLEETVTRNNLEAAEEIVRQLRLRDIGGIVIIDFVDMVLESNRELVLRRLVECLGRDRTRHQVTEITSLGLVQMTRKRVGEGLVEAFSTTCDACEGRGFIVHDSPVEMDGAGKRARKNEERSRRHDESDAQRRDLEEVKAVETHVGEPKVRTAIAAIATATRGGEDDDAGVEGERSAKKRADAARPAENGTLGRTGAGGGVKLDLPERARHEPHPRRSLDEISLPQPGERRAGSKETRASRRRVAVRAAGSPPPSHNEGRDATSGSDPEHGVPNNTAS